MSSAASSTLASCEEKMKDTCPSFCTWRISSMISVPVLLSRFAVGSSARITAGCLASARAIATRWR